MTAALWEVQKAVFDVLVGMSPAIAGGRIYDDVPNEGDSPGLVFPYIEIGVSSAERNDADMVPGSLHFFTLDVWDRANVNEGRYGQKTIKEIMAQIDAAFHKTALTITGRDTLVWVDDMRTFTEPDGVTEHGIIQLRVSTYQTP